MTNISEALAVASHHYNLGETYRATGKLEDAIASYRQALALKPDFAEAHKSLGIALWDQGKLDEAITCFRQALTLKPDYAEAHNNLGIALWDQGKLAEAIACYCQALALKPNFVEAHHNLGNALYEQLLLEEAAACYRQALALRPDYVEAHNNLGNALLDQGKLAEAIACFRQALALKPDYVHAHCSLGLALLSAGDLSRGFTEYEWRWRLKEFERQCAGLILPQPFWDGSELNGRTILLYAEQGFGTTIQFIRYAPLVARRGGRVIVACQPELVRLLASVAGIARVVSEREPLPDFDLHAPLLSLPRIIGTTLETIPAQCLYLIPPESSSVKVEVTPDVKLKVGIVWAGLPIHRNDRNRSCPLSYFLDLAELPGVAVYSLQKQPMVAGLGEVMPGMPVHNLSDQIGDWADTAAAICQLDLVLTVDTGVAHLAGALGRPVWVLLPHVGMDWRWMTGREDSPWYPSMRLFRQEAPGDWPGVFARVSAELQTLLGRYSKIKNSPS